MISTRILSPKLLHVKAFEATDVSVGELAAPISYEVIDYMRESVYDGRVDTLLHPLDGDWILRNELQWRLGEHVALLKYLLILQVHSFDQIYCRITSNPDAHLMVRYLANFFSFHFLRIYLILVFHFKFNDLKIIYFKQ